MVVPVSRDIDGIAGRKFGDLRLPVVAVHEVAGPEWLDPYYFRFGASSVLNDLIMQRRAQLDGHYSGADYVTVD